MQMIKPKRIELTGVKWKALCEEVLHRDRCRCVICKRFGRHPPHHIIFRAQGGPDSKENLITLCTECHNQAHILDGWADGMSKKGVAEYLKSEIEWRNK